MKTGYKLRANEKIYLCPISDIHLGSPECNPEYFEYCLDTLSNIKQPKRIYLVGDLIEQASKNIGNSSYRQIMSVDDQVEEIIRYLKPFKKDIVFSAMGNHELRSLKEFDMNVNRFIANSLGCKYGNQYIDRFTINGDPFDVYIAHGKGSSAHFYTAESKILRDTQHIDANVYLNGHNHRCGYFSVPKRTHDGIVRKHYAFTGSFLKYMGYADQMQLPVLPEAFLNLSVNKDLMVRGNLHYIDQVRPDLMEL